MLTTVLRAFNSDIDAARERSGPAGGRAG
jgi:hypothetical protein